MAHQSPQYGPRPDALFEPEREDGSFVSTVAEGDEYTHSLFCSQPTGRDQA